MRNYIRGQGRYTQRRLGLKKRAAESRAVLKDATMTTVLLDGETRRLAKAVARATGISVGELIRRGLRKILSEDDK